MRKRHQEPFTVYRLPFTDLTIWNGKRQNLFEVPGRGSLRAARCQLAAGKFALRIYIDLICHKSAV
jgi:hypothetical protein